LDGHRHDWATFLRALAVAGFLFAELVALQLGRGRLGLELPSPFGTLARSVAAWTGIALLVGLYRGAVYLIEGRNAAELTARNGAADLGYGIAIGGFLFGVTEAAMLMSANRGSIAFSGFANVPALLSSAALAAVGEEIVFRGSLYRAVECIFGMPLALGTTALVFGPAHLLNHNATLVGAVGVALESGILLGLAFSLRKTIWLGVGIHFGWNFTEGGIFGADVSGGSSAGIFSTRISASPLLSGGSFGPEASVFAMLVCLGASAVFLLLVVRHGRALVAERNGEGRKSHSACRQWRLPPAGGTAREPQTRSTKSLDGISSHVRDETDDHSSPVPLLAMKWSGVHEASPVRDCCSNRAEEQQ